MKCIVCNSPAAGLSPPKHSHYNESLGKKKSECRLIFAIAAILRPGKTRFTPSRRFEGAEPRPKQRNVRGVFIEFAPVARAQILLFALHDCWIKAKEVRRH